MSLFSFYREESPDPSSQSLATNAEDRKAEKAYANIDFHRSPSGCNLTTFFQTPRLRPTPADFDGLDFSDGVSIDTLDLEGEVEGKAVVRGEASGGYNNHRVSEAPTLCPSIGPMSLPIELWELVFSFITPGADDESFPRLNDLLSCALTCRVWALIALPMLYRTHGYGVLMPKPGARHAKANYFPVDHCIDAISGNATIQMLQLWRTLLLSCFTASRPTSPSRFTTFTGATLFPYITYVQHLDVRTLVMVLSGIARARSSDNSHLSEIGADSGDKFFAGALGAFEIVGEVRRERMIVDGPEYRVRSPAGAKDVQLFVGDTALMILDFLYPHLYHLHGFVIPKVGLLRLHTQISMAHPVGLLTSLHNLTSLVISSGWMLSSGLGRAIASIRPTIIDAQPHATDFSLVVLDWRYKTYYAEPYYPHDSASPEGTEDYNHTEGSIGEFFLALNPNSITSLDFDLQTRFLRPRTIDEGERAIAVRQAKSLKALRVAHFRCTDQILVDTFTQMSGAGFRPKALALIELYNDSEGSINREQWRFTHGVFNDLEYLELTRFSGMFDLAAGVVRRTTPVAGPPRDSSHPSQEQNTADNSLPHLPQPPSSSSSSVYTSHSHIPNPQPIKTLKLTYTSSQLRESASESFLLFTLPCLSATLTTLKLVDTDHDFISPIRPRRRTHYDSIYGPIESPLESLTNLHTLILTGDIAAFLFTDERIPHIISALKHSLVICDLCLPTLPASLLERFLELEKLESLVLREWNWEDDDPRLRYFRTGPQRGERKLTVDMVKRFWERARMVRGPDGRVMLGLRELGIAGGFLEVAGGRSWGAVRKWGEARGGRFWWSAGEMPKIG